MRNVIILNGSPKKRKAVSEKLAQLLLDNIGAECETEKIYLYETEFTEDLYEKIYAADCVVMAQPLYVDCLPARVLEFMEGALDYRIQKGETEGKKTELYFIINCGFREDSQNDTAINILNQYCKKAEFEFCGGAAVGSGAIIFGSPREAELSEIFAMMARRICSDCGGSAPEIYRINAGISKFLFKAKSDKMWTDAAKKRGLRKRDLKNKYYE